MKVLGVLRSQERALMVVKPPGYVRIAGVFEIDNCVFIAVEKAVVEELRRPVSEARKNKLGVGMKGPLDEATEIRRGGCAVSRAATARCIS
jgi:hypothetical protein